MTKVEKAPSKKSAAKTPPVKKAATTNEAHDVNAFDGNRLVALLGAAIDDPRIAVVLRELGHEKPITGQDIELKKLGISIRFRERKESITLSQIRFILAGPKVYGGRLPHGLASDLKAAERKNVLKDRARRVEHNGAWSTYVLPEHELEIGFGKTHVEMVAAIAHEA